MNAVAKERLFGYTHAFDDPGVMWMTIGVAALLLIAPLIMLGLSWSGKLSPALRSEVVKRYLAWDVMVPLVVLPILAGAAWAMVLVLAMSLLCYREFARACGLFRDKSMSAAVVAGIVLSFLAVLDHWYNLFVALPPLMMVLLATVAIVSDQPKGYIQRVGLSSLAYLLFGVCLMHIADLANDTHYRGMILLLVLATSMNDIFAFCVGKFIGGPKLVPNTSPGKTRSGAIGAVVLTTAVVYGLAGIVFAGTVLTQPVHRIMLGLIVSIAGILGDLTISGVKRDVGIKDMGAIIPGHGGVLDRCNSLLLAAPAYFYYIGYFRGIALDQPIRIFTQGLSSP